MQCIICKLNIQDSRTVNVSHSIQNNLYCEIGNEKWFRYSCKLMRIFKEGKTIDFIILICGNSIINSNSNIKSMGKTQEI